VKAFGRANSVIGNVLDRLEGHLEYRRTPHLTPRQQRDLRGGWLGVECVWAPSFATYFEILVGAELQYGEPLDDVLFDERLLVLLAAVVRPLGLLPDDVLVVVSTVWSIVTVGLTLPLGLHALGASSASVSLLHLHIHDSNIAAVPTVAAAIRRHSDHLLPAVAPPGAMADSAPRPPRLIPSPGRPSAHRTPSPTTHTNNTIHRI
jgi:hypothetical protein